MKKTAFLQYLQFEKRFSHHTLKAYEIDLEQFYFFLNEIYSIESESEVKHLHLRSWIVHLMQKGISSRSINRKLSSLKSFFKFLQKRGDIIINPTLKVIAPKSKKRLVSFLSKSNIEFLLNDYEFEDSYSGKRDKVILEVLYATGMRRSELINLKEEHIDFSQLQIKVMGKGKKERIVPFSNNLYRVLKKYIADCQKAIKSSEDFLFLTDKGKKLYPKLLYNIVKRHLGNITSNEHKGPHTLRHSFATHLSDNGAELNVIKELLGHSSLAATQIYTHNSIERIKRTYELAHPKAKREIDS
jgi:integrase/recombinase XerC